MNRSRTDAFVLRILRCLTFEVSWRQRRGVLDSKRKMGRRPCVVMPNPSVKLSANGVPRWPTSAGPAAHFALAVQRDMPSSPALQEPIA